MLETGENQEYTYGLWVIDKYMELQTPQAVAVPCIFVLFVTLF